MFYKISHIILISSLILITKDTITHWNLKLHYFLVFPYYNNLLISLLEHQILTILFVKYFLNALTIDV